ncbi:hypothetical protein NDU88_002886 [Pleurodeles waltl]|uniref:Uncharacterized protein n=1 Tax=Pleurodeles waltl TaxID=8319 RepID=A0AAV7SFX2_PLEWA|nr:hypothetical protein NDU88_002886 [Pleurodeles waltl]
MARTCPGRGSLLHLPACAPLLRPTEGVLIRDTWPLRNLPPPRVLPWGLDKGEGACERSPHAVGARQSGPPLNELKMLGPPEKRGRGPAVGAPRGPQWLKTATCYCGGGAANAGLLASKRVSCS